MKIIQFQVTPQTENNYESIYILTEDGELFECVRDGVNYRQEDWVKIEIPIKQ